MNAPPLSLAVVGQPLFGNQWLALLAIMAGIAVFMIAVAGIGRWLAATHPDAPARPTSVPATAATVSPSGPDTPSDVVMAVIAASVSATLGSNARIASVNAAPSVEALMQQWSLEGRRQIYSSHKVR